MTCNTWELSGVIVLMGEKAYKNAKKANRAKECGFDDLYEEYRNVIWGIKTAIQCMAGFDLCHRNDCQGYITCIYITYKGDMIGLPWQLDGSSETL